MKNTRTNLLFLSFCLLFVTSGYAQAESAGAIMIDTPEQLATIIKEKRLCAMLFSATWCGPCRMTKPVFKELASEYQGQIIFALIDVDNKATKKVCSDYFIRSMPTIVLLDKNGKPVERFVGMQTKLQLKTLLGNFVEQYS